MTSKVYRNELTALVIDCNEGTSLIIDARGYSAAFERWFETEFFAQYGRLPEFTAVSRIHDHVECLLI